MVGQSIAKLESRVLLSTAAMGSYAAQAAPPTPVQTAIQNIKNSDWAKTPDGQAVVAKIDASTIAGAALPAGTRGDWNGATGTIQYNSTRYGSNVDAIASELVHEASHGVYEDRNPASKTGGNTLTEERFTNTNQLDYYSEQKKKNAAFSDPDLDKRQKDRAAGNLDANIQSRYNGGKGLPKDADPNNPDNDYSDEEDPAYI